MTETTEELNVEPIQKHGLSIMHIKLNDVVMKKLASGLAPASIVFNGLKAVSTIFTEYVRESRSSRIYLFLFIFTV
jgi:hypothetical protein